MATRIKLQIREKAEALGFTVDTLARASSVNFNTVRAIWSRKVQNPSLETVALLARAMKLPVEELYITEEVDGEIRTPLGSAVYRAA